MKEFEFLTTYPMRAEAESAKVLLEKNGVKCFLQFNATGDILGSQAISGGPTDLYVAPGHLEQARELLGLKKE